MEWVGYDINSGGFYDDGLYWSGGENLSSGYSTFQTSPLVIDVAVDRVNNLMWIRVSGGYWNNNPLADPVNAVGGVDISGITGNVCPCYTPYYHAGVASQATVNSVDFYDVPTGFTFLSESIKTTMVYPNSLENMRNQVIDTVGQESNILPRWMLSKQANGSVLGFTPAWVIAYTKPGQSGQIAYNIKTTFGSVLNQIDFEVDRYELDNLLTHNWDRTAQQWTPHPPSYTTFDDGSTGIFDGWVNNSNQTVQWVNNSSQVVAWASSYNGQPTVFDGNSLKFIAPVDMYSNTQIYDKYLVFPKRNILE